MLDLQSSISLLPYVCTSYVACIGLSAEIKPAAMQGSKQAWPATTAAEEPAGTSTSEHTKGADPFPFPPPPLSATRGDEICNETVVSGGVRALLLPDLSPDRTAEDEAGVVWRAWTGVCHPLLPPYHAVQSTPIKGPGPLRFRLAGRACICASFGRIGGPAIGKHRALWPSFFKICNCQWLWRGQGCREGPGRPGDLLLVGRLRDSERIETWWGEAAACRRLRHLRRLKGRCAFALCRGTVFSAGGHWPSCLYLPSRDGRDNRETARILVLNPGRLPKASRSSR